MPVRTVRGRVSRSIGFQIYREKETLISAPVYLCGDGGAIQAPPASECLQGRRVQMFSSREERVEIQIPARSKETIFAAHMPMSGLGKSVQ